MRKQAGEKNQTALHERLPPVPSGRAAGTEPEVKGKPVRIVSANVLIDREMPLHVCDKAPLHPSGVFVLWCLSPITSLKSPKLPSLGLCLWQRRQTEHLYRRLGFLQSS